MAKRKLDRDLILKMHSEGYSYEEIADAVGSSSWRTIYDLLFQITTVHRKDEVLDVPKVKALAKAGWPVSKIVDEFGYRFKAEEIRKALNG